MSVNRFATLVKWSGGACYIERQSAVKENGRPARVHIAPGLLLSTTVFQKFFEPGELATTQGDLLVPGMSFKRREAFQHKQWVHRRKYFALDLVLLSVHYMAVLLAAN